MLPGTIDITELIKASAELGRKMREPFPQIAVPVMFNRRVSSFWSFGILVQRGAFWIGVHFSEKEKRYCINLIPFFTIWICEPGGLVPKHPK